MIKLMKFIIESYGCISRIMYYGKIVFYVVVYDDEGIFGDGRLLKMLFID